MRLIVSEVPRHDAGQRSTSILQRGDPLTFVLVDTAGIQAQAEAPPGHRVLLESFRTIEAAERADVAPRPHRLERGHRRSGSPRGRRRAQGVTCSTAHRPHRSRDITVDHDRGRPRPAAAAGSGSGRRSSPSPRRPGRASTACSTPWRSCFEKHTARIPTPSSTTSSPSSARAASPRRKPAAG